MDKAVKQKYYKDALRQLSSIISFINEKKESVDKPDTLYFFLGRLRYYDDDGKERPDLIEEGEFILPFRGKFQREIAHFFVSGTTFQISDILNYCTRTRDVLLAELASSASENNLDETMVEAYDKRIKKIEKQIGERDSGEQNKDRIIEVQNRKVIELRDKALKLTKQLELSYIGNKLDLIQMGNISDEEINRVKGWLIDFAEDCRKKNGKLNYSRLGKKAGRDHKTMKRYYDNLGIN